MIIDQLRCGGVLEAVRVSRAGYPTRYPHNVFKARYYILGDAMDTKPVSPIKRWGRGANMSKEDSEVKRLVSKIAFDIWEADHQALLAALEEDDIPFVVSVPSRDITCDRVHSIIHLTYSLFYHFLASML